MSTAPILLSDFQKTEIELWRPIEEIAARFNMSYYTAWEVTTYRSWKYVE